MIEQLRNNTLSWYYLYVQMRATTKIQKPKTIGLLVQSKIQSKQISNETKINFIFSKVFK